MFPRTHVNVRIGAAGVEMVDQIAAETGTTRSEVIRAALSIAMSRPAQVKAHVEAKMKSRKEQM